MSEDRNEYFMRLALEQARLAEALDEVPVGAVVVREGRVIAAAHNRREVDADPAGHAELLALRAAAKSLGSWRLDGCAMFVTLEPCPMCAGALVNARVSELVYAAADPKMGCVRSLHQLCDDARFNHRLTIVGGVLAEPAGRMLTEFFRRKRAR